MLGQGEASAARWTSRASPALLVVVAVGLVLRVVGSDFGFPLLLHPDEWAVVDGVIDMARRGSFEPHFYLRPDHVEMKLDYLLFAAYALLVERTSIVAAFAADPVPFYWLARLLTAAFGVATIVLAHAVAKRWSPVAGLAAAVLFAIFPPFVTDAHFATPDVPLTFALMLVVYALVRYVEEPGRRFLLLACFAAALGVAIKYPGALFTVGIAATVVAAGVRDQTWRRVLGHGALALAAVPVALFVISPSLLTNFSGVRDELAIQSAGNRLGRPDLGLVGTMSYYAELYAGFSGLVLLVLAGLGLFVAVRARRLEVLPWFIGVVVWVALSTMPLSWVRWGIPMWTTPLLLAAVGFSHLVEVCRGRRLRWVPLAAGLVAGAHLSLASAASVASMVAPDTREASLRWVESRAILPEDTAFEGYTPFQPGDLGFFFAQAKPAAGGGYELTSKAGRPATHVVMSSTMYRRVLADDRFAEGRPVYAWVRANYELVASFDPARSAPPSVLEPVSAVRQARQLADFARGRPSGPRILVYALPGHAPPR